jgi:hypothetical protein
MDLVISIELEPLGIFTEIKANDSRNNMLRIDRVTSFSENPAHELNNAE